MGSRQTRMLWLVLASLLAVGLASAGTVRAERLDDSNHGGRPIFTEMTGAAEAPGPGDPDGSGTAFFTFNHGQGEVCFELNVENITLPASAAHIHRAPAGSPGPIVIGLTAPDANGHSSGCVENVNRVLIKDILKNPDQYYVNVHTLPDFGPGAVRGQLG